MEVVVITGAIRRAKLQSNHDQQTNTQCFTGRMSFLSPNQQCQSTEGKKCSRLFDTYQRVMCVTCTGMSLLGRETHASDDDDDDDDNVLYQATLTNNNTPYASRSTNTGTDNTGTSTTSAGSTRTGNSGTSISNSSSTTSTTTSSTNSGVGLSREIR